MPTLLHCFSDNVGRFVSHAPYTIKIQKVVTLLACREDTGKKKGEASQELLVKTPPAAAFLLLMVLAFSLHATEAFLRLIKILLNPLFFFFFPLAIAMNHVSVGVRYILKITGRILQTGA